MLTSIPRPLLRRTTGALSRQANGFAIHHNKMPFEIKVREAHSIGAHTETFSLKVTLSHNLLMTDSAKFGSQPELI